MLVAFIIFVASMVTALIVGVSMVYALLVGLVCFLVVGYKRGYKLKEMMKRGVASTRDSFVVIGIMAIIGMVTAIWRMCGTITIVVYYGMKIITPSLFLLVAFAITTILSYALGTSFGVSATAGVMFMALARSGGVDPIITAGVLMSAVYYGDRGSPASSAATLACGLTHVDMMGNVKMLFKTSLIPLIITTVVYAVLSVMNPLQSFDQELVTSFEETFNLSAWAFVPAIIMLALPLMKVSIKLSMGLSIVAGVIISYFIQGQGIGAILKTLVLGYTAETDGLGAILNGGGISSMVEVMLILTISTCYSGIFEYTGMLDGVQDKVAKCCTRFGRFLSMSVVSLAAAMIFCNQTITTLMASNLFQKPYKELGASNEECCVDICNSVLLLACMIPWCIGCSVPLAFLQAPYKCVIYGCYMYLVPIIYFFTKKHWFKEGAKK